MKALLRGRHQAVKSYFRITVSVMLLLSVSKMLLGVEFDDLANFQYNKLLRLIKKRRINPRIDKDQIFGEQFR